MALTTGGNLGLFDNGILGEQHYTEFMRFLRGVDMFVMPRVISNVLGTPPASPTDGDLYIIPAGATGVWGSKTNQMARWAGHLVTPAWDFVVPKTGWKVRVMLGVTGAGIEYEYVTGTGWRSVFLKTVYADQTAAGTAGLVAGELFILTNGTLMVKT